jgi:hypothetical protein
MHQQLLPLESGAQSELDVQLTVRHHTEEQPINTNASGKRSCLRQLHRVFQPPDRI